MDPFATDVSALSNPLDIMEELVSANDWIHDRSSDSELAAQVSGHWTDYHICAVWQPDIGAVYFSCHLEIKIPGQRRAAVHELVALLNERMWMGHFDVCSGDSMIMFRHTIPLRGTRGASVEQIEDMVDTAVTECERLYPALHLVIWGGQEVTDAISAAMMDTVGEA